MTPTFTQVEATEAQRENSRNRMLDSSFTMPAGRKFTIERIDNTTAFTRDGIAAKNATIAFIFKEGGQLAFDNLRKKRYNVQTQLIPPTGTFNIWFQEEVAKMIAANKEATYGDLWKLLEKQTIGWTLSTIVCRARMIANNGNEYVGEWNEYDIFSRT